MIVFVNWHALDYAVLKALLIQEYGNASIPLVVGPDTTWGAVGDELPDGGRLPLPGKGGPNCDYWNGTLQENPSLDIAAFHYYDILVFPTLNVLCSLSLFSLTREQ